MWLPAVTCGYQLEKFQFHIVILWATPVHNLCLAFSLHFFKLTLSFLHFLYYPYSFSFVSVRNSLRYALKQDPSLSLPHMFHHQHFTYYLHNTNSFRSLLMHLIFPFIIRLPSMSAFILLRYYSPSNTNCRISSFSFPFSLLSMITYSCHQLISYSFSLVHIAIFLSVLA